MTARERNATTELAIGPRRGFTLMEMLVVVAIILILAALLAPALRRALASAQDVSCQNNMRQLAVAQISYCADYQGQFKRAINNSDVAWQKDATWQDLLLPYALGLAVPDYDANPNWGQSPRLWQASVNHGGHELWVPKGVFACPSVSLDNRVFMEQYWIDKGKAAGYNKWRRMDIGMNRQLIVKDVNTNRTARDFNVKDAGATIMFMDMLGPYVGKDQDAAGRSISDKNLNGEVIWFETNSAAYESVLPYRHNAGNDQRQNCFNVACVQGNVRVVPRVLMPVSNKLNAGQNKTASVKFYLEAFVR